MNNALKPSAQRIQSLLQQYGLTTKVIEFKELTRTAQEAADAIGCEVGQIAKTLIFKSKNSLQSVCIIASGSNKVDEKKVEELIGQKIEKPDADYVVTHTGFAIGGIPPFGYSLEIKPLIDQDLMQYSTVWAAAGTPNAVFELSSQNLLHLTQGRIVDIRK
jgi:prolyl-tRNA editing enzyme YbaK/EbsC (Cys-tRNA(Pro) deacylase)